MGTRRRRSTCPISLALELVGDPWSLLVVRDLMFKGLETYQQFLGAGEGIASNVLADRLRRLERAGILSKSRDPADGRKYSYRLTEKGIDLAPVLVELVLWSASYEATGAPQEVLREMRDHRENFLAEVKNRWLQARARPSAVEGHLVDPVEATGRQQEVRNLDPP